MTTVRSVTVRLNADVAGYIADMKRAGAATDAAFDRANKGLTSANATLATSDRQLRTTGASAAGTARQVSTLDRSVTSLDRSLTGAGTGLGNLDKRSASADRSINQLTGRLRLIADLTAILGPGLAPIAAVGVPAVAGLASQLGAAALGGAALGVAFQGVGGAVEAVQKYDLAPTAANLEAAQEALSQLGPDALAFVGAFREFRPVLTDIRDATAAGVFPGLVDSLGNLERLAPVVSGLMRDVGASVGEALDDGTASLASERWRAFFDYLRDDAPDTITTLAETLGVFSHGLAELTMSLDPGADSFEDWLLRVGQGFDSWASSDEGRRDVEAFLAYAAENGPKVADFFSSLVGAVSDLAQAAAPLGGPVLDGLTAVLDAFGRLMDSDLGTPLLGGLAALSAYNRALSVTSAVQGKMTAKGGAAAAILGPGGAAAQSKIKSAIPSVRQFGNALVYAAHSNDLLTKSTTSGSKVAEASARKAIASRAAVADFGKSAARVAGPVAGLAVATTGLGDSLGVTNAASLGLMGTIAGPWGAAVGTGVGLLIDLSHRGDLADQTMSTLASNVRASGLDFVALNQSMDAGKTATEGYYDNLGLLQKSWEGWDRLLTGSNAGDTVAADFVAQREEAEKLEQSYRFIAAGMGEIQGSVQDFSLTDLTAAAARAQPALDALGYSLEDLQGMDSVELTGVGMEVMAWREHAESAAGRIEGVGAALADLSSAELTAAESSQVLDQALTDLMGPDLNLEAATDAWRGALMALEKDLRSGAGFEGFTKRAMENRAMTRDYAIESKDRLVSLAAVATTTEGQMARAVRETRNEFIASGVAAGFSREEMVRRANALQLTPKLVRTVFEVAGIDRAELRLRQAKTTMEGLPKRVQTRIEAKGIPETTAGVNRLARRLDLTEKQRRALITLKDLASKGIEIVNGKLRLIDNDRARPTVDLFDGPFRAIERGIRSSLRNLDGQKPRPVVNLFDGPFRAIENGVRAALRSLDGSNANPTATLIDHVTGIANTAAAAISRINSRTVTITAVYRQVGNFGRGVFGAEGMMLAGGVQTFADGGLSGPAVRVPLDPRDRANAHQPELATAGATRVWREPETGGESYIPWADDHRRPRARAIAAETVRILGGGEVEWYARGGHADPETARRERAASIMARSGSASTVAGQARGGGATARQQVTVGFAGPAVVDLRMPDGTVTRAELHAVARGAAHDAVEAYDADLQMKAG